MIRISLKLLDLLNIPVSVHLKEQLIITDISHRLGVLDVSATRQMHSTSPMLAIEEAGGHSPSAWSWGLRRY